MIITRHRQTQGAQGSFGLLGSVVSPYYPSRWGSNITTMRVIVERYDSAIPGKLYFSFKLLNGSSEVTDTAVMFDVTGVTTDDGLKTAGLAALDSWLAANSYNRTDGITWPWIDQTDTQALITAALSGPTSYQTIVSQTGTAAPAVSGGFTPTSTYAAGTTFTWARTGVGVYTLTASTAVFNTSKTGVFIAPLQNLNASVRGVVTSTTVITFTTAVQSVAVLGLLGLTTTNTDALLSGTMIYVQTYS